MVTVLSVSRPLRAPCRSRSFIRFGEAPSTAAWRDGMSGNEAKIFPARALVKCTSGASAAAGPAPHEHLPTLGVHGQGAGILRRSHGSVSAHMEVGTPRVITLPREHEAANEVCRLSHIFCLSSFILKKQLRLVGHKHNMNSHVTI